MFGYQGRILDKAHEALEEPTLLEAQKPGVTDKAEAKLEPI
jgi:hypothetical protein